MPPGWGSSRENNLRAVDPALLVARPIRAPYGGGSGDFQNHGIVTAVPQAEFDPAWREIFNRLPNLLRGAICFQK